MLNKKKNTENKVWFTFRNLDEGTPTLDIFDEIGGWGTWADEVISQLDAITASEIKVRLFSPGGYVDEGIQIYNALRRHQARIIVEIDSQASSIASVIAMAGDEIRMADTAFMMIHDPWGGAMGTAEDMRQTADVLDKLKASIVLAYSKRTGLDSVTIEEMMAKETWMSAAEAVDLGFADIVDDIDAAPAAQASFSNKIVGAFKHVPKALSDSLKNINKNMQEKPVLMLSPMAMARIEDSAAADKKEATASQQVEVIMNDNNDKQAVDSAAAKQEGMNAERERIGEIQARASLAAKNLGREAVDALAKKAIDQEKTADQFSAMLNALYQDDSASKHAPIGLSDGEVQAFSVHRALAAAATGDWSQAGFEHDVVMATAQKLGSHYKKGVAIPTDVLLRRPQNVITTTGAAPAIQTDVQGANFIELLRNKMRVREAGATVLEGLVGNQTLPRQTGGVQGQWLAEGVAPNQVDQTYDSVSLTPKGVSASTRVTLLSLMQSSVGLEALTIRDIVNAIALAADFACINGSGIGAEPKGILKTAGIQPVIMGVNGGALSNVDPLVDMETLVASSNVDDTALRYMTNAKVVGALKKIKSTTGEYLFSGRDRDLPTAVGNVNTYDVLRSNQVPSNGAKGTGTNLSSIVFGDWSQLLIGEWGALVLDVEKVPGNPGAFNINALQFMDCAVAQPKAFSAITDIIA
jgi:HK97 family phage major capsid protein